MKRIFVVGCPRSGTTLLQSFLASHPDLISFTESHFFEFGFSKLNGKVITNQLIRSTFDKFAKENFDNFYYQVVLRKFPIYIPEEEPSVYGKFFLRVLDIEANQNIKCGWVEKTPSHVKNIDFISKLNPDIKFIHIIRDGIDTAASNYELGRSYKGKWGDLNILESVNQWNEHVLESLKWINKSNHFFVKYEKLIDKPQEVLKRICEFLSLIWDQKMLDYKSTVDRIITKNEPWKENNKKPLRKMSRVNKLTTEEMNMIKSNLQGFLYSQIPWSN